MKVEVFTLCWNEIDVLPWVVDYWQKYATHVTVFDNGSTDGSTWYLSKFDWITVKEFLTEGMNDAVHADIKNKCWKGSDADFVVVCDMDEMLLAPDILKSLENMKASGATICKPVWYELQAEERPKYETGKMLHETSPMARPFQDFSKAIIFDPKAITNIGYSVGAHKCDPQGNVKWYEGQDIYALHINHNLSFDYKIQRYRSMNANLSQKNKNQRWGIHYGFDEGLLRRAWEEDAKKLVDFSQIMKGCGNG